MKKTKKSILSEAVGNAKALIRTGKYNRISKKLNEDTKAIRFSRNYDDAPAFDADGNSSGAVEAKTAAGDAKTRIRKMQGKLDKLNKKNKKKDVMKKAVGKVMKGNHYPSYKK